MKKAKILVAEDDPRVVIFIEDQLENLGHQVIIAHNGREALDKVKEDKPDLIVLDVMMPEMDGYQVCHHLKSSPKTKNIPILMLTAKGQLQDKVEGFDKGTDDYLPKPYDKAEFEARITALLKRSASPPFDMSHVGTIFSISCKSEHRLTMRLNGNVDYNDRTREIFRVDTNVYARYADNIYKYKEDWRFQSREAGKQLFQKIFVEHSEVLSMYNHALGAISNEEELHFRFEADREFLKIPLEFLYNEGEYLILKHSLARSNNNVRIKKKTLSPSFFNDIWSKNNRLKILLIASNTRPPIPGVDQEISTLETALKEMFEDIGISVKLKTIPTDKAAYETVREELKNCSYHIIHYAGHGNYDHQSPEKSALFFWEKPDRKGEVKKMPVSEFKMLLRNSDVRFVYLSCCLGAATGGADKLLDDDFLGIADGLIQAGVPSVLGFRWPVSDSGAITLSNEFYQSLARQGQIDTALLDARCEIAAKDRDDISWISPILIMQSY
jgi:DNA-binding response OmpR family regulator